MSTLDNAKPLIPAAPQSSDPEAFRLWAEDMVSVLQTIYDLDTNDLPLTGGTMLGSIDMGDNDIDTTGDIDLANTGFIINPADPTGGSADTHVGDRGYNDGRYIQQSHDVIGSITATGRMNLGGGGLASMNRGVASSSTAVGVGKITVDNGATTQGGLIGLATVNENADFTVQAVTQSSTDGSGKYSTIWFYTYDNDPTLGTSTNTSKPFNFIILAMD